MPTIRRLFGFYDDPVAGGSEYDDLTTTNYPIGQYPGMVAGRVPALDAVPASQEARYWPVTGGTLDENTERIDRNEEVRGRRAVTPPVPFRAAPVITVPVPAYRSVVEKIFKKAMGGTDTVTGAASPYTHAIAALGFGATALPPINAVLIRDDLHQRMSGGMVQRAAFTFPLDAEGSCELELWGLYAAHFADAAPTADFTGISENPMMLRDAQIWIDGSPTPIPDLEGFEFTWVNNMNRHWAAFRNRVTQTLGTPSRTYKVWWPSENRLGAAQDVTFALQFGSANTAQELAAVYAQIQKFVFEVVGDPITGGTELLRITIYGGVWTGGGPDALSARGDITARYEGMAGFSVADANDVKVEVVNDLADPIT